MTVRLRTMRIDVYLAECGEVSSRTEAKRFVEEGAVCVNGKQVTKPSFDVTGDECITVDKSVKQFVSRGGEKLNDARDEVSIDVAERLCIEIGASSGGLTDCLLKRGAKHVIALDSGSGQLVDVIRKDDRVTVLENFNARYMKPSDFEYDPDLAVMDVSFISATYVIPAVYDILSTGGEFVCLIKPQFEVGRTMLGKGGIVKDDKARNAAVSKVVDFAVTCGFCIDKTVRSPIKGGDGNIEFLAHFIKPKGDM